MFPYKRIPAITLALCFFCAGCVTNDQGHTTQVPPKDTGQSALTDTGGAQPDTNSSQTETNNANADTASPDIPPEIKDDRLEIACGLSLDQGIVGEAYLGAPCEEHADCETGFCYDGNYLGWEGGFKFCTFACGGCSSARTPACADFDVEDGPRYKCIRLPSCHVDENPVREFCVPSCQGSNGLGNCDDWFGTGTYSDCQIPNFGTCGAVGASKACFIPEP